MTMETGQLALVEEEGVKYTLGSNKREDMQR